MSTPILLFIPPGTLPIALPEAFTDKEILFVDGASVKGDPNLTWDKVLGAIFAPQIIGVGATDSQELILRGNNVRIWGYGTANDLLTIGDSDTAKYLNVLLQCPLVTIPNQLNVATINDVSNGVDGLSVGLISFDVVNRILFDKTPLPSIDLNARNALNSDSDVQLDWSSVGGGVGILGATDGSNPFSGNVGEYIESFIDSDHGVSLTDDTEADVTSVNLTAGDWDIEGNVNLKEAAATVTGRIASLSTGSATIPLGGKEGYLGTATTTSNQTNTITLPRMRLSVGGPTTAYLVAKVTFSAGTISAFGGISARRVR